jgi:SAM-dependent methyltransferase
MSSTSPGSRATAVGSYRANRPTLLNIACGTKTSSEPGVVNLDWSMYLVIKTNPILLRLGRVLLDKDRLSRLDRLSSAIVAHDLRKGIPFEDNTVDIAYHSHFLEHLDPPAGRRFLLEVKRVLKPGGIQRIVVPDLERLCAEYLAHLRTCLTDFGAAADHDTYVAAMIEQAVRREAFVSRDQKPFRRAVERFFLGDARMRGETHQWMYDRVNLPYLLRDVGYRKVTVERFDTSVIPEWNRYGLDRNEEGREYKPESLYVEAVK